MRRSLKSGILARAAVGLGLVIVAHPNAFAQQVLTPADAQEANKRTQYQEKLQQILNNKAGYAAAIVQRWEGDARASGKWDENYSTDLQAALMKLEPDNLLAAGEAPTYRAMRQVLMTGRLTETIVLNPNDKTPNVLGSSGSDLVYTPITPCRILDTRFATAGAITTGTIRSIDVDGTSFTSQGGNSTSCGVPYAVAAAVAITLTVTGPIAPGYLTAFSFCSSQPTASTINYAAGETIATGAIVPMCGGAGVDMSIYAFQTTHALVDVVGYFAAPVATPLDCTTVSSAVTAAASNLWTNVDAFCPSGRTATGGGYNTPEGSLGYPGVWLTTLPISGGWRTWVDNQNSSPRSIQTWAVCCRIPGR